MKYRIFFLMMIALSVAGMAQTHRFPLYSEQSQAVTLNLADDTTLLLVNDGEHTLCGNVVFYTFTGTLGGTNRMIALTGGSQNASATNTPPGGLGEILTTLGKNMVDNPIHAIASANYVGILFWAIVFGVCLKKFAKPGTLEFMRDLSDMVSDAVRFVIQLAPFGIFGLMFSVVAENGLSVFIDYGKLLLLLVGAMLTVVLIVYPLMLAFFLRSNPYPLVFQCLRGSGITAFFTRSSAANIPVNMALCERLGLNKAFYSVSIPLGATINMGGAAVTITVMTLAVAHTLGVQPRHDRHPELPLHARRLRRLRRCRRLPAPHSHGLLAVRHRQRHRHAGRGRRLCHRRGPGLRGDGHQLQLRRHVHRLRRGRRPQEGLQGRKGIRIRLARLGQPGREKAERRSFRWEAPP